MFYNSTKFTEFPLHDQNKAALARLDHNSFLAKMVETIPSTIFRASKKQIELHKKQTEGLWL